MNSQPSTAKYHGTITLSDGVLAVADPSYLDAMSTADDYGFALAVSCEWDQLHVYTVEQAGRTRALVVTDGSPVPEALLQT